MNSLVRTVYGKSWIPYKNKVEFYLSGNESFDAPVTTAHGFFFNDENKLLLVKHKVRGWETPGGHIESGESFESAMRRELHEEAQMNAGDLKQLGFLKKMALEDRPEGCEYPHPLSYCIFYAGKITGEDKFTGDESIIDVSFFNDEAACKVPWIIAYKEYYQAALDVLT